MESELSFEDK